ncbi:MAG TPA: AAA family ATPase [Candidatus Dormibacteraeota bacterium]
MGVNRVKGIRPNAGLEPPPLELAFRGRDAELEHVLRGLRSVAAGRPVRQLISGEQGIGKSRLVAEALAGTRHEGVVVHAARARELESDRPFGTLIDALDLYGGAGDRESSAIGRLIARATRRSSDAEQRHAVISRIAAFVKRQASAAPVALVLEDVQWADRWTAAALAAVIAACADRPLGVVLTRRLLPMNAPIDELLEQGRPAFELIELDGLAGDAIATLASEFLGATPGPRAQQGIEGAGGNPAMLLALLHGWRSGRALRWEGATIETSSLAPPPTMRPAILARISRLSPRCQDLLTVAAVFERPFGVATLASVAERSVIDVLADLREALAARLLLELAGVLSFRHRLVSRVLYETTPATVRAELHRQIADALAADHGSPELIGHHQRRASELSASNEARQRPGGVRERPAAIRWERLTKMERLVALLVAGGLSNKQVGGELGVSARTVETHLAHVFAKLGINSRVELAAAVGRAGLRPDGEEERSLTGKRRLPAAPAG